MIPKCESPKQMSDFKSISLCNVIYKIIAKTLANRLKKVLDTIILFQNQSVFVPGRVLITNNVVLGFECIQTIDNQRSDKKGYIVMKLDMSKVYDRVK